MSGHSIAQLKLYGEVKLPVTELFASHDVTGKQCACATNYFYIGQPFINKQNGAVSDIDMCFKFKIN